MEAERRGYVLDLIGKQSHLDDVFRKKKMSEGIAPTSGWMAGPAVH
jgi:hypothetical protein